MNHFEISKRMDALETHFFASLGLRISELESTGHKVIRLDEGSPDLPPAPFIIQALIDSAKNPDHHRYQSHRGTGPLRQAWADMYLKNHEVSLDSDTEIIPLLGSKEGIFHLSLVLINPGDIALIPDPGYITYSRGTLASGGQPYFFPLHAENNYLPDLSAIPEEIAKRAKILWLNFPNNPTSAIAPPDFFKEAVEFAYLNNLLIVHDAAYSQITYDHYKAFSILQVPGAKEVAIEFNSLSKSHNMAGWRVGVVVGNSKVIKALFTLKTNIDSGQFLPIIDASVAALTGDQNWLASRNEIYRKRRDIIIQSLHRCGLKATNPQASLYVWCQIPDRWDSIGFCSKLLEDCYLSLTPGSIFGKHGEKYIRISLTTPTESIVEAMDRFTEWIKRI